MSILSYGKEERMIGKGRGALLLGVVGGMVVFTSCVSPYYGTARIEQGVHSMSFYQDYRLVLPLFSLGVGFKID
jgi:hypothetical protein